MAKTLLPDAPTRILNACRLEIAERGVRGLRVQHVAKRAGVSLGLIYYHFEDRTGLLQALLMMVNEEAQQRGTIAARSHPDDQGTYQLLSEEIDDDERVRANSVVWNEIRAIAVFDPALRGLLASSTAAWHETVIGGLAHGEASNGEAEDTAILLTALVEGISGRWLTGQLTTPRAHELLRRGVEALVSDADGA